MNAEDRAVPPVLVVRRRGDTIESVHRGWAVVWEGGEVRAAAGDPAARIFTRSCTKPFQALALVASGAADRFGCGPAEIAVACSSHNGEAEHRALVARLLERGKLSESALQCGKSEPFGEKARREFQRRGESPSAIVHNCSGKHAAFLLTQIHLGGSPDRYLDPDSPVQRLARELTAQAMGLDPAELGLAVDGCSAPTFRPPLSALAAGFARLANPEIAPAAIAPHLARIAAAIAAHPHEYSGTGRICSGILRASGGAVLPKNGAEGVYAFGARGGKLGFAVKVEDGNHHGYEALVVRTLRRRGLLPAGALPELAKYENPELRNAAGLVVGRAEVVAEI
jgi:L-asparaginase II